MVDQKPQLEISRCPHCNIARPRLTKKNTLTTTDHAGEGKRYWAIYDCATCGGLVTTASLYGTDDYVTEMYPSPKQVAEELPPRTREYLKQAIETTHAPAGSIMLAASAVDSMLKAKDLKQGTLYFRIDKAAEDHIITKEMALWAHDVRLDANDQRHSNEEASLPAAQDAMRAVDFAKALGDFLFVFPNVVAQGRAKATAADQSSEG